MWGTYNQVGILTVSNVTSGRRCIITLVQSRVTFTMSSGSFPDRVKDNSGACYIIKYNSTTVIYNGKIYTDCKIISKTMKAGNFCSSEINNVSYLCYDTDGFWYCRQGTWECGEAYSWM